MKKTKFEDGKLVKQGYVVIENEEITVVDPEYEGETPLSSEKINKMQEDIEESVVALSQTKPTTKEKVWIQKTNEAKKIFIKDGNNDFEEFFDANNTEIKNKIANIESDVEDLNNNKVDKVSGKQLSTNDFNDAYKTKLDNLENYDDTDIKTDISAIQTEQTTQNSNINSNTNEIEKLKTENELLRSQIPTRKSNRNRGKSRR